MSLPDVTQEPHFEKQSFRVHGKIFATVPEDQLHIHIFLDELHIRSLVGEDPGAFDELRWGKKLVGVRVDLDKADPAHVCDLLEEAWRRKAPKRLIAQLDASQSSVSDA